MSTETKAPASEQARLRKERREKRILSQGTSRLERIAGLNGGATAREALHPDHHEPDISEDIPTASTTSPSQKPEDVKDHEHVAAPGRNVYSVDGRDDDPFNMLRGGNDAFANVPEELKDDPMWRLLMNTPLFGQSRQSGGAGMSSDSSSDDLSRLAEKINKQLLGGLTGSQQSESEQVAVAPVTSAWKWKFVRMVSIAAILAYLWGQLEDYHFSPNIDINNGIPVFYTFIVFSLSLQAARLVVDRGRPLPGSTIATIGSLLPHPFGTALISFARYRMIFTDLLEDFAALLFGLSLIYWFKTR